MKKPIIGWQKYEDMLEKQLDSPLMITLYGKIAESIYEDSSEEYTLSKGEDGDEIISSGHQSMIPIDERMLENITLSSNFDCWMGYTNFNITPQVKAQLNQVAGVEVLKICSRYRFFIGIGRMFDFKEVRKNIEDRLSINKGENVEKD